MTTKKVFVEVADTPFKREMGLMHRKRLGQNDGMLFKFQHKSKISFWMKNTYIPLDIAFLDDNGKILQIKEMSPLSTRSVGSDFPCKLALEVNRGWFKKNEIEPGDYVGNIDINSHTKRFAQVDDHMADPSLDMNVENGTLEPDVEPPKTNHQSQPPQPNNPPPQPSPKVTLERTIRQKIEDADMRRVPITIQYTTQDGNTLPPRKLVPVPHKGYPIISLKNGYAFQAVDASPDLNLGGMEIEGGHIKSYLLDNIVSLEVEEPKLPPTTQQQNNQQNNQPKKEDDMGKENNKSNENI